MPQTGSILFVVLVVAALPLSSSTASSSTSSTTSGSTTSTTSGSTTSSTSGSTTSSTSGSTTTSTSGSSTTATVTVTTTLGATTGVSVPAPAGVTTLTVTDTTGWSVGDTFINPAIPGSLFFVTAVIPATRRLDTDGRRLATGGSIEFTPATSAPTPSGTDISVVSTATTTSSSTSATVTTTVTDEAVGTFITKAAPAGSSFIDVLDTTGFATGNTISISSITTMLFQIVKITLSTRRLDTDGRRLTTLPGQFGITPALPQNVNVNDQVFLSGFTVTTTTEMPWGLPWFFWFLLCCGLCCCLSLCCAGPLGVLPFLGGKKKPTKKPAPAPQPTVVEEVVTVEDEVPLTGGVPMASMAVPMASAAVPMASATYPGTTGYPMASATSGYPMAY